MHKYGYSHSERTNITDPQPSLLSAHALINDYEVRYLVLCHKQEPWN